MENNVEIDVAELPLAASDTPPIRLVARPRTRGVGLAVVSERADDHRLDAICDWLARREFVVASLMTGRPGQIDETAAAALLDVLRGDRRTDGRASLVVFGTAAFVRAMAARSKPLAIVWFCEDADLPTIEDWPSSAPLLIQGTTAALAGADRKWHVKGPSAPRPIEFQQYGDAPVFTGIVTEDALSGRAEQLSLLRAADFARYHVRTADMESIWTEYLQRVAIRSPSVIDLLHEECSVHCVPTGVGGVGREAVSAFLENHFMPQIPRDMTRTRVSLTLAMDRLVDESVLRFTHAAPIEWMLPGVAATGRVVDVPVVTVVCVREAQITEQRMYWDQASLLSQLGVLPASDLPVIGADAARALRQLTGTIDASKPRLESRGTRIVVSGYQGYEVDPASGRVTPTDSGVRVKSSALAASLPAEQVAGRSVLDLGGSNGFYALWLLMQGARTATVVEQDQGCIRLLRQLKERMPQTAIEVKDADVLTCGDRADIVLALGLIHWTCASPTGGRSLTSVIDTLASATQEVLVVEWLDPEDATVVRKLHANPSYNRQSFEDALGRHFPSYRLAADIAPTRHLYVAQRGT